MFRKKKPSAPKPSGTEGEMDHRERLKAAARSLGDNLAWTDLVCPAMKSAIEAMESEILDNERLTALEKEKLITARIELKRAWAAALTKLAKASG